MLQSGTDPYHAAYPYLVFPDIKEGGFFAEHADLEGCASQGETAGEAVANLDEARALWIGTRLEDGLPVPEPVSEDDGDYIFLRVDDDLRRQLDRCAARNGVGLDQLLTKVLAAFAEKAREREEAGSSTDSGAKSPYGGVISLIEDWLADDSGYDEEVGPQLEEELRSNPLKIG